MVKWKAARLVRSLRLSDYAPAELGLHDSSPPGKMMFKYGHVNPSSLKADSLRLQQEPLFHPVLPE